MKILIGDTGVIGKTLSESIKFDETYNSSNIKYFDPSNGNELYLSCLPAAKWLVNQDPLKDYLNMMKIFDIIRTRSYSKVVLISTIDVYTACPEPKLYSTENDYPSVSGLSYGANRYIFEMLIRTLKTDDLKIFRLPGIYGKHFRKNILFDMLNMDKKDLGHYPLNIYSRYQWYNIHRLASDIEFFSTKLPTFDLFNLFPPPISCEMLLRLIDPTVVAHKSTDSSKFVNYDFRTMYMNHDGDGYLMSMLDLIIDLQDFIDGYRSNTTRVG